MTAFAPRTIELLRIIYTKTNPVFFTDVDRKFKSAFFNLHYSGYIAKVEPNNTRPHSYFITDKGIALLNDDVEKLLALRHFGKITSTKFNSEPAWKTTHYTPPTWVPARGPACTQAFALPSRRGSKRVRPDGTEETLEA